MEGPSLFTVADPGLRWGARYKMFSHSPMSGARGAKGLVWYILSYVKSAKLGPGAMAPVASLRSATGLLWLNAFNLFHIHHFIFQI